ncbi:MULTISPECIES: hypothetical protein [Megasphaera]|nr:hypothetical protein [Megasphaera sp.]
MAIAISNTRLAMTASLPGATDCLVVRLDLVGDYPPPIHQVANW